MFNQVTYNVLIERFKAFADGHYKIERFSHGQIDVTDISKDQHFPWMHVVPVSIQPSGGSRSFTLDVVFADMPRDKEQKTEYQRESLSDCIQLAEDLLAEIKNGGVIFGEDVTLEEGSAVQPFMEEYTHVLTGVTLSLTITFPWNWSACDIPADWTTGGSSSGGGGGIVPSLVLKVNNVDNVIQDVLDLVNGTNITIVDLGDGRVQINSNGGVGSVSWGDIIGNIADQLDLAMWFNEKADVSSLAEVAFTGDYNDLVNKPTIPSTDYAAIEWDINHTAATGNPYIKGDRVWYGGNVYACTATNDAIIPTNTSYWALLGVGGRLRETPVDWNATTGDNQILNKPTIPNELRDLVDCFYSNPLQNDVLIFDAPNNIFTNGQLGAAAYSNDYNDLDNLPTLPSVVGDMTKAVYDPDDDGIVEMARREMVSVINKTGATLTKGTIVYLKSASSSGTHPEVLKASAASEATSSKTIGGIYEDIPNDEVGYVVTSGEVDNLDTSAYSIGQQLWLSDTAGQVQTTPATDPSHAVFIGTVTRSQNVNGRLLYHIQNGYEFNELHDVSVPSPTDNDYVYFDGATSLWKSRQLTASSITDSTNVGQNLVALANPSAVTYLRINADNSVSALSLAQLKTDLGLPNRTVLASDVSITAVNTALNDVTGLTFPIVAGNKYKFTAYLVHTVSAANVGLRYAVNANVAVSSIQYRTLQNGSVVTALYIHHANALDSASSNSGGTVGNTISTIEGMLVANNTGTVIIRFAKSQANAGTLTVKANSFVEYQIL